MITLWRMERSRKRRTEASWQQCVKRRVTPSRAGPHPANPHGALEFVGVLQHFLPGIGGQVGVIVEVLVDHGERGGAGLPSEEGAEPGAEEEDAAIGLNKGQRIERGTEPGQRELLMLHGVE